METSGLWGFGAIVGFVIAVYVISGFVSRYGQKLTAANRREVSERMEALFRASFPELQPHFHPARVYEYVKARRTRTPSGSSFAWTKPPGFPAAARADLVLDGMRDKVSLLDAAGARIADFVFEEHAEGGVIRLGKGKFTVNVKGPEPRVRYWHPEREFKWTPSQWRIKTGMSDSPLDSSSSSDTSSSSHDRSSSSSAAAAAAGAGIVAAGGTFDGGGASAAWDDSSSGSGSSSSSGSDSSSDFSSVESGSSTSSSTSY